MKETWTNPDKPQRGGLVMENRHRRRGMVRGRERTEYPIAWFDEQGLFRLKTAQARWLQSQAGNH